MSEEAKRYVCSVEGCGKRFWTGTHARRHEELHDEPMGHIVGFLFLILLLRCVLVMPGEVGLSFGELHSGKSTEKVMWTSSRCRDDGSDGLKDG